MATITIKQFFRNVFYIMLTLSATPYMLLSTFLSLFMEVPVISLSMEVYLPGYDLTPKYEEEDEHEDEEEEEEEEEEHEDEEDEDEDEEEEDNQSADTYPILAPINVENHDHNATNEHCTPIPRHNSEVCPESPLKRRPTDIEDEIDINSTARILTEDFNNITTIGEVAATAVDLPTIDDAESSDIEPETPPPSIDSVRQEPSESFSSEENDE